MKKRVESNAGLAAQFFGWGVLLLGVGYGVVVATVRLGEGALYIAAGIIFGVLLLGLGSIAHSAARSAAASESSAEAAQEMVEVGKLLAKNTLPPPPP